MPLELTEKSLYTWQIKILYINVLQVCNVYSYNSSVYIYIVANYIYYVHQSLYYRVYTVKCVVCINSFNVYIIIVANYIHIHQSFYYRVLVLLLPFGVSIIIVLKCRHNYFSPYSVR